MCGANDSAAMIDVARGLMDRHVPEEAEVIVEFLAVGREQSATFAFWADFMEGAQVLLHLFRAEKECSMKLHMIVMYEAIVCFRGQACPYICGRYEVSRREPP